MNRFVFEIQTINILTILSLNIKSLSNFKQSNATYLIKYVECGIIEL